jgi:hypothetical protein
VTAGDRAERIGHGEHQPEGERDTVEADARRGIENGVMPVPPLARYEPATPVASVVRRAIGPIDLPRSFTVPSGPSRRSRPALPAPMTPGAD